MKVAVIGSGSGFIRLFLLFFCSFFLDYSGRRLKMLSFLILFGFCLPISQYQGRSARRRWRRGGSLSPSSTPAEALAAGCPREGTTLLHGWFSILYASVCVSVFFFTKFGFLGCAKLIKGGHGRWEGGGVRSRGAVFHCDRSGGVGIDRWLGSQRSDRGVEGEIWLL